MELSQLKMFKAVAQTGSIVKASERLHCVPSNITTRLKQLENEFGTQLFIRHGRGLVISPDGITFLRYVDQILGLCDEACDALGPAASPTGPLKIGAIESFATARLPKLLADYHARYPSVDIEFSTGTWPMLIKAVSDLQLDGAIIAVKPDQPDINFLEIYQEALVVVAHASLGRVSCAHDLLHQPIFMWPVGCPYRAALTHWLSLHQVEVQITSIASYATILACVSAGAGITLLPKAVYEQFSGIGNLQCYCFNDLLPIHSYFIWNQRIRHHPARQAWIDLLKASTSHEL